MKTSGYSKKKLAAGTVVRFLRPINWLTKHYHATGYSTQVRDGLNRIHWEKKTKKRNGPRHIGRFNGPLLNKCPFLRGCCLYSEVQFNDTARENWSHLRAAEKIVPEKVDYQNRNGSMS